MIDIRGPTEFLERVTRLCKLGMKLVPDMMYRINHAYKNREELVEFEIKVVL